MKVDDNSIISSFEVQLDKTIEMMYDESFSGQ